MIQFDHGALLYKYLQLSQRDRVAYLAKSLKKVKKPSSFLKNGPFPVSFCNFVFSLQCLIQLKVNKIC